MKKILLICLSLLLAFHIFAQGSITGKVIYKQITTYKNAYPDTLSAELDFGSSTSIYSYDKNTNQLPKEGYVNAGNGGTIKSVFKGRQTDSIGKLVYLDFRDGKFITREIFQSQPFIVPDTVPHIKWQIGSEKKTIANLECITATGKFRGREFIVWFTEKVPVNYGPWKLCGLPGLILEAKSKDNEVCFIAETIRIPAPVGGKIKAPTNGQQLADYAAFRKLQDKKASDYTRFLQSMGSENANGANVKVTPQINRLEKSM